MKLNRIKSSKNIGEVQAAVAKVGENIVKELHSIATSQNRAFQSMMARFGSEATKGLNFQNEKIS